MSKKIENKVENKIKQDDKKTKKISLWGKFMLFCNGVKSEFQKIHWPNKKDMIKYSTATIIFIVFFSLFFYMIDILFALLQTLFN